MLQEKVYRGISGWLMVAVLLATTVAGFVITGRGIDAMQSAEPSASTQVIGGVALLAVSFFCWFGFRVINPNTALAIQLFGDYKGTVKTPGFWWMNPLTSRRRVS